MTAFQIATQTTFMILSLAAVGNLLGDTDHSGRLGSFIAFLFFSSMILWGFGVF